MSTVPFRCPYCGATEIHPEGRKLPEMCGQCAFDRESGPVKTKQQPRRLKIEPKQKAPAASASPSPAAFVTPGPPPPPPLSSALLQTPSAEYAAREARRRRKLIGVVLAVVFGAALFVGSMIPDVIAFLGTAKLPEIPDLPQMNFGKAAADVGMGDPDRSAVYTWLRENWHSSDWEEVKWWPRVTIATKRQEKIADLKRLINASIKQESAVEAELKNWNPDKGDHWAIAHKGEVAEYETRRLTNELTQVRSFPDRICKIRIRTRNLISRIEELTFNIKPDESAEPIFPIQSGADVAKFAGIGE